MEGDVEERFERIERDLAEVAASQRAHALALPNLDDLMTKLAAAQLVTEQKLQGLIDALGRGGNVKH
jgi:hypothetical protein